jgi:hypothetical protein
VKDGCPNCHAGALRVRPLTYAAWHATTDSGQEQFVIAPRVPAWMCDVCGVKFFDIQTVEWLAPLLGPLTNRDEGAPWSVSRGERDLSVWDGGPDMGRWR